MPNLSIIIPTHKRATILLQCLDHIATQTIASQLEVIVVSDGHDTETVLLFDDVSKWPMPVHFFEIEKSQQGVARNYGVKKATAPLVLFIGDDAFLAPDACEKHLAAHARKHEIRHPKFEGNSTLKIQNSNFKIPSDFVLRASDLAVLGFTTWDTDLNITPAMRWLEKTGWQFGYTMLLPYRHAVIPANIQHQFTYTINLSIPTAIAKQFPFREDLTLYGWEDILWGQQLRDAGIALYYEPDAVALHHHLVTLDDSLARIETLGQSLMHLTKVAPELDRKPTGLKLLAYKLIALTPTMRGRHYRAFLRGLSTHK